MSDSLKKADDLKAKAKEIKAANEAIAEENNIHEPEEHEIDYGERVLSAIGYISFLCILPLLAKPDSEFCQHHGRQGLVLAIMSFVVPMGAAILYFLLYIPALAMGFRGIPIYGITFFSQTVITFISFYGVYLAFKKSGLPKIPVIGQLAKYLVW